MTENSQQIDRTLETSETKTAVVKTEEKGLWANLFKQGIWNNNPTLVQLLGLCPLLAVSSSATNALGLGLATMFVLICTNAMISIFRKQIPHEIRIPIYVMIIATTVTVVQLLMNAYTYTLYQSLGIFIPLIVTNCIVIGRAEAFASKNSLLHSIFDGFSMGLGMTLSLFVLGSLREILGNGTLFDGLDQLFGSWAKSLRIEFFQNDNNLLLAILPPGAFLGLALMLALKNMIENRKK
ncbi:MULTISPECIES: electron transport complex subunit E [Pasteurellaceae]|uniref:Ion-translocating oxidoreductase complex subunit E n=1 Tax=Pasteurella bettyae CCUG 2042 TaxID=1095749 RepID=I3DCC7_9PAST|nr:MULTISPECIES: electron transport complex subunit E [Pasteurellaceae]EIJ69370.1 electron transport complex, RnfABCDGE type, E subunit [Pasteurella bettyae CCUG 2042]SUB21481.1 electron transport complex protein RnfE [Pasteurella bettyae]